MVRLDEILFPTKFKKNIYTYVTTVTFVIVLIKTERCLTPI